MTIRLILPDYKSGALHVTVPRAIYQLLTAIAGNGWACSVEIEE
ncbi:hypothetical protein [Lihuaxuella thermophila]|nr:hypothetical protein [Lihuaxuella thermophila]